MSKDMKSTTSIVNPREGIDLQRIQLNLMHRLKRAQLSVCVNGYFALTSLTIADIAYALFMAVTVVCFTFLNSLKRADIVFIKPGCIFEIKL